MARVLIISPDRQSVVVLDRDLASYGYETEAALDLEAAGEVLETRHFEAILVDLSRTGPAASDLGKLVTTVRETGPAPIIGVVSEEGLRHYRLETGFDDFILKPCGEGELAARIKQAIWRRSNIDGRNLLKLGDLLIDLERYEVSVAGRLVALTFKEYELLRFLATHRGRVFTRETLLNRVWGYDYFGGDRTVDVHIRRLRSKIEDRGHVFIETIRNVGYKFRDQAA